jgi:hypothetical protein
VHISCFAHIDEYLIKTELWIVPHFWVKFKIEENLFFWYTTNILEIFEVKSSSFPSLTVGHPKTIWKISTTATKKLDLQKSHGPIIAESYIYKHKAGHQKPRWSIQNINYKTHKTVQENHTAIHWIIRKRWEKMLPTRSSFIDILHYWKYCT